MIFQGELRNWALALFCLLAGVAGSRAQGTAFTYQGRLNDANGPASGSYDFQFSLYATNLGGAALAGPVTNATVAVSNGLFLAQIDFGSVFTGTNCWLDIAVRTNGVAGFTELSPRQPVTPVPTALFAGVAGAVAGPVPASQVTGILPLTQLNTNALLALAAAQAAQTLATAALPAGNLTGVLNPTNLPAAVATNLLNGSIMNALTAGCVNDGVTDDTAALQALFNLGTTVILPPGRYLVSHILYLTNNTTILGQGATLVLNPNYVGATLCTAFNTKWAIYGLDLEGGSYGTTLGNYPFTCFNGTHVLSSYTGNEGNNLFGFWDGSLNRHGLVCNADGGGVVLGVSIHGYNGAALYPYSANGQTAHSAPHTQFQGIVCYSNFVGILASPLGTKPSAYTKAWLTNYVTTATNFVNGHEAQYAVFSQCACYHNDVGVNNDAANNIFIGCHFDANYHAVASFGCSACSGITGHGRVTGCSLNHNSSFPLIIMGTEGASVDDCSIRENAATGNYIVMGSASDLTVKNCDLDGPPFLLDQNGQGVNAFIYNNYIGTWNSNNIINDGHLVCYGNYSATVPGDTDGSTLSRVGFNDGGGLTNLNTVGLTGALIAQIISTSSVPVGNLSGVLSASNLPTAVIAAVAAQIISTSSIPASVTNVTLGSLTVQALGGTNDDTAAFQAAFNSGVPVICPLGDYNVSNILITVDNENISGYGCRLHMQPNIEGYCVCTRGMTNVSLAGLSVYGGIQQTPGWTLNPTVGPPGWTDVGNVTVPNGLNTPPGARSGFYCNMQGRSRFADLTASGFNVAGFYLANHQQFNATATPVAIFQNNFADWCYMGFTLPQSIHDCDFTTNNVYVPYDANGVIPGFGGADYTVMDSPVAHNCTWGIFDGAWNVPINNPQISACAVGICISDNTHNTITGGSIDHESGVGIAYYISGCAHGPMIVGQDILDNPINVYVTKAGSVTFANCQFSPGLIVATNLYGAVLFANCITNGGGVVTDNTGLNFLNCYGFDATNSAQFAGVQSVYSNAVPPSPSVLAGSFWNSNNALYWVTATHTNYVTGP